MIDDIKKIKSFFKEGQKIVLSRKYLEEKTAYNTSVIACDDNNLFLSPVFDKGQQLLLEEGKEIFILLINEFGLWGASLPVLEVFKNTKNDGIFLPLPSILERVQRREYVRMDFAFALEFHVLYRNAPFRKYKLKCYNLSANGIAVMTSSNIEISKRYEYKVVFNYKGIEVDNFVEPIYINPVSTDSGSSYYVMGCKFLSFSQVNADKILALINKEQIRARKKGIM